MCAPSMPKPPDPYNTANAQGNVNQETAYAQQRLNQTNQVTPYGSLTYTNSGQPITYNKFNQKLYDERVAARQKAGTPGLPDPNAPLFNTTVNLGDRWDAVQTLSPEQQGLYDRQMGLQTGTLDVASEQLGRVSGALGSPLDFGNAPAQRTAIPGRVQDAGTIQQVGNGPAMQSSFDAGGNIQRVGNGPALQSTFGQGGRAQNLDPNDYAADRQRVEQALMDRMDPYLQQRREQEQTRLLNQGFADTGSEGYSSAMDEVYRGENDARMAAILSAGQEQQRLSDMGISRQGFNNQAAAQRFGQNATAADFANQTAQQEYANRAGAAGFNNQAQAQQFAQNAAAADFANQANQQGYQNRVGAAGFNNQAQAQQFGQNTTQLNAQAAAAAFANQARQQAIQEQMLLRQTPINEISALMSGSQVQQPNFVNTPQSSIQAPDLQGAIYANYQAQMQQAQMQADQNAAMIQGVASLGGSGLGAFGAINPFGWGKK
jgi:hypothetical protein